MLKQTVTHVRRLEWDSATALAVANATAFFLSSLLGNLAAPESVTLHQAIAIIFFVGSLFVFYQLITANALDALAFYVLGAGLFFGFGTFYGTIAERDEFRRLFDATIQQQYLAAINLMNATSVFIIVITASLMTKKYVSVQRTSGIKIILDVLFHFRTIILAIAAVNMVLRYYTYPVAENLIVRGALSKLFVFVPLAIMLIISYRRSVSIVELFGALALAITAMFFGLVSLSKTEAMIPMVSLNVGLFLNKTSQKLAVIAGIGTVVVYYLIISPIVTEGRSIVGQSSTYDTISARVNIIYELTFNLSGVIAESKATNILARFSATPFQYYLIHEYDEGRPGASLADWWVALVPRILWFDKPNVTRFGPELYALVFNSPGAGSALAPTYDAEAYWNYGWIGVVIVSMMIGLEVGWLTRKWRDFMSGEKSGLGIVVFMVPIALFSFWVETWIAASYVGGFISLVVMIEVFDILSARRAVRRSRY